MNQPKSSLLAEPFIVDRILSFLRHTKKNVRILDLATGHGYLIEHLKFRGFTNLYAADINAKDFKLNKRLYHFKQVDANQKLPYPNAFFDIVISSETIEHLENPRHFIEEANRILKPKGLFITSIPSVENIVSRLYFLFTGMLAFHTENSYLISGHIAVMPSWLMDRFCNENHFKRLQRTYSSFYIPILKVRLTHRFFLNRFFGWIIVTKYQKVSAKT